MKETRCTNAGLLKVWNTALITCFQEENLLYRKKLLFTIEIRTSYTAFFKLKYCSGVFILSAKWGADVLQSFIHCPILLLMTSKLS